MFKSKDILNGNIKSILNLWEENGVLHESEMSLGYDAVNLILEFNKSLTKSEIKDYMRNFFSRLNITNYPYISVLKPGMIEFQLPMQY